VGCDVGVTKEDDLVGRSERQVDKEMMGCDVGTSHPTVSLSTCLSDPPTRSSSLVTPTSHPTVSLSTCLSDPPTRSSSLVGTMSEASDSERCEGVAVEEGVVGEAMRHADKGTGDTGGTGTQ
jgi:hypothetical protein